MSKLELLRLPEAKEKYNLDDRCTSILHREIIKRKSFLKNIYNDYYWEFKKSLRNAELKCIVEIGSGGGFIKEIIPNTITSDIINIPDMDIIFSALKMPFKDNSVDAFLMIDVLHHLRDAKVFFKEAIRCLKVGGKIVMVEPANTLWSKFVYKNFHHETFDPSGTWGCESDRPLSVANGAIPWIVFCRDRRHFQKEFPSFKVLKLKSHTPFRYIVSGGVSMRQLLPSFAYNIVKGIELILSPLNKYCGMFMTVELEKIY